MTELTFFNFAGEILRSRDQAVPRWGHVGQVTCVLPSPVLSGRSANEKIDQNRRQAFTGEPFLKQISDPTPPH